MGIGEQYGSAMYAPSVNTVTFIDGPCEGHTLDLPPWDVTRLVYAAVVEGPWANGWAHVLGDTRTLFNDYVMRVAHPKWEFGDDGRERMVSPGLWTEYVRASDDDSERPVRYRLAAEPAEIDWDDVTPRR